MAIVRLAKDTLNFALSADNSVTEKQLGVPQEARY